jgi:hypothetical protein
MHIIGLLGFLFLICLFPRQMLILGGIMLGIGVVIIGLVALDEAKTHRPQPVVLKYDRTTGEIK